MNRPRLQPVWLRRISHLQCRLAEGTNLRRASAATATAVADAEAVADAPSNSLCRRRITLPLCLVLEGQLEKRLRLTRLPKLPSQ